VARLVSALCFPSIGRASACDRHRSYGGLSPRAEDKRARQSRGCGSRINSDSASKPCIDNGAARCYKSRSGSVQMELCPSTKRSEEARGRMVTLSRREFAQCSTFARASHKLHCPLLTEVVRRQCLRFVFSGVSDSPKTVISEKMGRAGSLAAAARGAIGM
jgi:hypothetical protein